MELTVDIDALIGELNTLATFSPEQPPAVTRVVFTEFDLRARAFVKRLCIDAGLEVREDPVGNTFARWVGDEPDLAAVGTGSHIDAIPNSGMYDGTVGVLGGLEAIRALQRSGFRPRRSIELLLFTSEEPTRFGIGCLGSRLLAETLTLEKATTLKDSDGVSLDDARSAAGFTGSLSEVRLPFGYYYGFVELHIEQGPLLERQNVSIGVVTDIAAPASAEVTIIGKGGHAGAVLMQDRHDALVMAAEIIKLVDFVARSDHATDDTVATVGICQVFPGAVNSIPSRVAMSLDVRDTNLSRRDKVLNLIETMALQMGKVHGFDILFMCLNADAPARSDPVIVAAIESACEQAGISQVRMVSRAYHDSLFMSHIVPMAMIFIPCRAGVSHRPDEYASPRGIEHGVQVLARTLAALSSEIE